MNLKDKEYDLIFHALSDSTRRQILSLIGKGPCNVSELTDQFNMSMPAITKHLNVLEKAGLLARTKKGRQRECNMEFGPLINANKVIQHYQQFWISRMDELENLVHSMTENKNGE